MENIDEPVSPEARELAIQLLNSIVFPNNQVELIDLRPPPHLKPLYQPFNGLPMPDMTPIHVPSPRVNRTVYYRRQNRRRHQVVSYYPRPDSQSAPPAFVNVPEKEVIRTLRPCAICLDDIEQGSSAGRVESCHHHIFHKKCLLKYLSYGKTTCPYCRG